ncbi:exopolyphosphatase/guanosine-5'-triphosphate,3'-diphosphate pyrophosphatase [Saccharothrix australiensis]|uniref:Exopolyphosphatase/guanosine-5'-triphosphate, 3'-diphosphate pyrophosphatase n=1 Tax=Saccharothrix australiensis TaxID=2072 RepID=A0A495W8Z9_9PSEU|nr:exopolyphosphatase/guanosine-5'-triphosphate,3'-diphosphate pyrophosphatase [Saccharothrix australiensis]
MLDVGCFSAHLVVVEGSLLRPVLSHKTRLRLDLALDDEGRLCRSGVEQVVAAVRQAGEVADRAGVRQVVPWATSSLRDAPNAAEVFGEVARRTGTRLTVLSGAEEARLSYLAARRWFGAQAGPLLVLDIGGGTVEVAAGAEGEPSVVASLPYGARTVTRHPVDPAVVRADVRAALGDVRGHFAVGCSKVFQQLARLSGARPQRDGPCVRRSLHVDDLRRWIPRLASMPARKRARLPGISRHRAGQCLAGARVAEALMTAAGHDEVAICPWSTREGLLLRLAGTGEDEMCRVA